MPPPANIDTLWASGFPLEMTAKDIGLAFERFGAVQRVDVPPYPSEFRPKYAFIKFAEADGCREAWYGMHGTVIGVVPLRVAYARNPPFQPQIAPPDSGLIPGPQWDAGRRNMAMPPGNNVRRDLPPRPQQLPFQPVQNNPGVSHRVNDHWEPNAKRMRLNGGRGFGALGSMGQQPPYQQPRMSSDDPQQLYQLYAARHVAPLPQRALYPPPPPTQSGGALANPSFTVTVSSSQTQVASKPFERPPADYWQPENVPKLPLKARIRHLQTQLSFRASQRDGEAMAQVSMERSSTAISLDNMQRGSAGFATSDTAMAPENDAGTQPDQSASCEQQTASKDSDSNPSTEAGSLIQASTHRSASAQPDGAAGPITKKPPQTAEMAIQTEPVIAHEPPPPAPADNMACTQSDNAETPQPSTEQAATAQQDREERGQLEGAEQTPVEPTHTSGSAAALTPTLVVDTSSSAPLNAASASPTHARTTQSTGASSQSTCENDSGSQTSSESEAPDDAPQHVGSKQRVLSGECEEPEDVQPITSEATVNTHMLDADANELLNKLKTADAQGADAADASEAAQSAPANVEMQETAGLEESDEEDLIDLELSPLSPTLLAAIKRDDSEVPSMDDPAPPPPVDAHPTTAAPLHELLATPSGVSMEDAAASVSSPTASAEVFASPAIRSQSPSFDEGAHKLVKQDEGMEEGVCKRSASLASS